MKKNIIIIIVIIFIIIPAVGIIYITLFKNNETTGSFELADYNEYISHYNAYFPAEEKKEPVGYIGSPEDAKKAAEAIWKEIYGKSITTKKPYKTFFDEENQVWLVRGTVLFTEGGPHILIQKSDGKILAVWHDKF